MAVRIEGKIAAILDKNTIVINRGLQHGVIKGETFYIYTQLGPFFDPDTNENLGMTWRVWGRVEVTIVEKLFCVARTEFFNPLLNLVHLHGVFGSRIELPVDDGDITPLVEKIKVGFNVASAERSLVAIEERTEDILLDEVNTDISKPELVSINNEETIESNNDTESNEDEPSNESESA